MQTLPDRTEASQSGIPALTAPFVERGATVPPDEALKYVNENHYLELIVRFCWTCTPEELAALSIENAYALKADELAYEDSFARREAKNARERKEQREKRREQRAAGVSR